MNGPHLSNLFKHQSNPIQPTYYLAQAPYFVFELTLVTLVLAMAQRVYLVSSASSVEDRAEVVGALRTIIDARVTVPTIMHIHVGAGDVGILEPLTGRPPPPDTNTFTWGCGGTAVARYYQAFDGPSVRRLVAQLGGQETSMAIEEVATLGTGTVHATTGAEAVTIEYAMEKMGDTIRNIYSMGFGDGFRQLDGFRSVASLPPIFGLAVGVTNVVPDQCSVCGQRDGRLLTCACHGVLYCSQQCQREDRRHRYVCNRLRSERGDLVGARGLGE